MMPAARFIAWPSLVVSSVCERRRIVGIKQKHERALCFCFWWEGVNDTTNKQKPSPLSVNLDIPPPGMQENGIIKKTLTNCNYRKGTQNIRNDIIE